jgi:hypothetical protein
VEGLFRDLRLGTVTVFGVLLPGIWFMTSAGLYLLGVVGHERVENAVGDLGVLRLHPSLAWIVGFVVAYTAGSLMRALSPEVLDRLSICLEHVRSFVWRRPHEFKVSERFPYQSLPSYLRDRGATELAKYVPWDEAALGKQALCSRVFVNYAKAHVRTNDSRLGDDLLREEAFVRSLSGVCWAAMITTAIAAVVVWSRGAEVDDAYWVALACNVAVIVGVIGNFHRQRLREVLAIIDALYLVDHVGVTAPPWRDPASPSEP